MQAVLYFDKSIFIYIYVYIYIYIYNVSKSLALLTPSKVLTEIPRMQRTAILIIIEGQLQGFQRFSSSRLVQISVENRYENGSTCV
jgi:hypothetical protein